MISSMCMTATTQRQLSLDISVENLQLYQLFIQAVNIPCLYRLRVARMIVFVGSTQRFHQ